MERQAGVAESAAFITGTGAVVIAGGLALGALRLANGSPPEQGFEGAVGSLALGAVIAAAGVLAILSLQDRPALLVPAAIVLVPLSFISFALVTLPLLVPAVMMFIAYNRRSRTCPPPRTATPITVISVFFLLVGAFAMLFAHQDPRSYVDGQVSGSVSDVITFAESIPSLLLTTLAIALGWTLAAPRFLEREVLRESTSRTKKLGSA